MSINNVVPLHAEDEPNGGRRYAGPPPQMPITQSEALKTGLVDSKATYRLVALLWEIVIKHYMVSTTPRRLWDPMASVVQRLSAPFIKSAETILGDRLASEVDFQIEQADERVEDARAGIESLEKGSDDIDAPESKQRLSTSAAVVWFEILVGTIQRDMGVGARHHRRVSKVQFWAAKLAPFVEALGLMAFCSYSYDVPWLAPWVSPLPWSVCLTVVLVLTFSLKFFAEHSGAAHNHAREAAFAGNKHQAEQARRSRLGWGILTGIVGLGITAAMVERALVALVDGGLFVGVVLLLLAILAGIACPIVTWMAVALDGSTASREVDALAGQLDRSRDAYDGGVAEVEENIANFDKISGDVVDRTLPDIVDEVQKEINEARGRTGSSASSSSSRRPCRPPARCASCRARRGRPAASSATGSRAQTSSTCSRCSTGSATCARGVTRSTRSAAASQLCSRTRGTTRPPSRPCPRSSSRTPGSRRAPSTRAGRTLMMAISSRRRRARPGSLGTPSRSRQVRPRSRSSRPTTSLPAWVLAIVLLPVISSIGQLAATQASTLADGSPRDVPGGAGLQPGRDYSFIAIVDGDPIRWRCSKPIPVALEGRRPEGADKALSMVVDMLRSASNLPLAVERDVNSEGSITVRYVPEGVTVMGMSAEGDTMGRGGPTWNDSGVIISGHVIVRNDAKASDPATSEGQHVLLHELAHAVGLDHARQDRPEVMTPRSDSAARPVLGPGDRYALAAVGC